MVLFSRDPIVLFGILILLPIVLILSWWSTLARHMSLSAAVTTILTIPGLVTCTVTMSTWLLVCIVSALLLIWWTAIVVLSVFFCNFPLLLYLLF